MKQNISQQNRSSSLSHSQSQRLHPCKLLVLQMNRYILFDAESLGGKQMGDAVENNHRREVPVKYQRKLNFLRKKSCVSRVSNALVRFLRKKSTPNWIFS